MNTRHNVAVIVFYGVDSQFPDFSKYRAIVSSSGMIRWEPAGVFETSCIIDITFYPYDTQVLLIILERLSSLFGISSRVVNGLGWVGLGWVELGQERLFHPGLTFLLLLYVK